MRTGGTHSEFWCDPWGQGQGMWLRRVQNPLGTNIVLLHIKSKVMKSRIRAGPRRSEDGGGGGGHWLPNACIERRKPREGEKGFSSYKGVRGPPREIFKTGLPESAFPCYFQVIFINLAGWFFFFWQFQEVAGSKTAGATFFCGIMLSLPLNSRRAVVSFWQKDVYCTG